MKKLLLIALLAVMPAAANAAVRIVVPARDIARGDVISEADLTFRTIEGDALMSGITTSITTVAGMQARRVLRAGEAFRSDDVRRPLVVSKGQMVTMQFSAPGVELTAMGRAMSEGGLGDSVTIQNPVSFRMISAIVIAPGTVRAVAGLSPITTARR
jgi:flagella basal body P-ring formation protein FlgA